MILAGGVAQSFLEPPIGAPCRHEVSDSFANNLRDWPPLDLSDRLQLGGQGRIKAQQQVLCLRHTDIVISPAEVCQIGEHAVPKADPCGTRLNSNPMVTIDS